VIAPLLCEPLVGFEPLQPPEAVQAAALAEVHVSVAAPPLATAAGATVNLTVGTAFAVTVTVTLSIALLPPGPLQEMEYVVGAAMADVF
jgi:hypothetical protein